MLRIDTPNIFKVTKIVLENESTIFSSSVKDLSPSLSAILFSYFRSQESKKTNAVLSKPKRAQTNMYLYHDYMSEHWVVMDG